MGTFLSKKIKTEGKYCLINFGLSVISFFYLKTLTSEIWKILPIPILFLVNGLKHLGQFRRTFRGAMGEEEAYYLLKKKFKKHIILRNIHSGRGDIDFLLIGSTGIIIIEVKNLKYPLHISKKKIRYGKSDFLFQLEYNENFVKRKLKHNRIKVPVKSFIWVLGKVRGTNPKVVTNISELKRKTFGLLRIKRKKISSIETLFN